MWVCSVYKKRFKHDFFLFQLYSVIIYFWQPANDDKKCSNSDFEFSFRCGISWNLAGNRLDKYHTHINHMHFKQS